MEGGLVAGCVGVASRVERHEGVERFHMSPTLAGRPLQWTSVYLVDGVLVDSGCSTGRRAFVRWLAGKRVGTVLTTHEHEDHVGNHEVLPEGVEVWATPRGKRHLDHGPDPFPLYRRLIWGTHGPRPGAKLLGEKVTASGRTFRVIPTPGHSDDHVAFLDDSSGAVFSGDAFMGKFRAARLEEDVHTELRSLRRLHDLDPTVLYPAHGPIVERPRDRLADVIEHFESLGRRAHRLAQQGHVPRRIAKELLGREPALTYLSSGEFSAEKLVLNLLRAPPAG